MYVTVICKKLILRHVAAEYAFSFGETSWNRNLSFVVAFFSRIHVLAGLSDFSDLQLFDS